MDDREIEERLRAAWNPEPPEGMRERVLGGLQNAECRMQNAEAPAPAPSAEPAERVGLRIGRHVILGSPASRRLERGATCGVPGLGCPPRRARWHAGLAVAGLLVVLVAGASDHARSVRLTRLVDGSGPRVEAVAPDDLRARKRERDLLLSMALHDDLLGEGGTL